MKKILICLFVLIIAVPAFALDGTQLLKQIDRNLNPESFEMYRKLINVEPDGRKKEFVLFSVKKGVDKIAALFLEPASEKGRSTLRLGENMWLYIPNVGKPIRITSLQSVIGGVFNNCRYPPTGLCSGIRRGKGGRNRERIFSAAESQEQDCGLRPAEDVGG